MTNIMIKNISIIEKLIVKAMISVFTTTPVDIIRFLLPKFVYRKLKERMRIYIRYIYSSFLKDQGIKISTLRKLVNQDKSLQLKIMWNSIVPRKMEINPYNLNIYAGIPFIWSKKKIYYTGGYKGPWPGQVRPENFENPPACFKCDDMICYNRTYLTKEQIAEAYEKTPELFCWAYLDIRTACFIIMFYGVAEYIAYKQGHPPLYVQLKDWWRNAKFLELDSDSDSDSDSSNSDSPNRTWGHKSTKNRKDDPWSDSD